ncbi:MAG: hypothetical protein E4H36_06610 [Spirochaetales bacterium]|nr:MAG: hypothetical protein E4H36_06610 [Spirochaetales bacterium]
MKANTPNFPLVFEHGKPGLRAYSYPACDVPEKPLSDCIEEGFLRQSDPLLPEISEPELVRHFTALSRRTFSVDSGFYPLGSCTMKYNPRINEDAAGFSGFRMPHPLAPESSVQGTLRLMHELLKALCEITGMAWGTLQPFAGAHG